MLPEIDLNKDINNGFLKAHGEKLKLLAILSSEKDKILWGIFVNAGEFKYVGKKYKGYNWAKVDRDDKNKADGKREHIAEYSFDPWTSNTAYSGSHPIIVMPLSNDAHSMALKIIEADGKPNFYFDKIYYCSKSDSNDEYKYNLAFFENLQSRLDIVYQGDEGDFYFCKTGKKEGFEEDANYFWLFKLGANTNKFRIPLPKNHLLEIQEDFYLTIKKENDNSIPIFEFGESKIKWEGGNCEIENFVQSDNIDFSLFDNKYSYSELLILNKNEVKVCYFKTPLKTTFKGKYTRLGKEPTGEIQKISLTSIQLNSEIFTKYSCDDLQSDLIDKYDLLSTSFNNIKDCENALSYTKKSNSFALLPNLDLERKKGTEYSIYDHYKIDDQRHYPIVTLISSETTFKNSELFISNNKIGSSLELQLKDIKIIQKVLDYPKVNDNGTFVRFLIGAYNIVKPKSIIDGAFEFELNDKPKFDGSNYDHNGKISFVLQKKSTQTPLFLWQLTEADLKSEKELRDWEIGYSIQDFCIPVKEVKPVSQDLTTNEKFLAPSSTEAIVSGYGERLQKQLIIPIKSIDSEKKDYYLCISESVNIGQDFRVDMRLIEVNPRSGQDKSTQVKVVVLDSSPQFVGLVDSNFLIQKGYDDGVWVLAQKIQTHINEGVWEIYDDEANKDGFHLVLPAQTIGEEFFKDDSIIPKILNYKFGSPAILKLSGDKLQKKYIFPPWDLRRLWGKAGDIQPGLPLLQSEFELLYGLQANLKPRNTSIAELGSRLGDLPVPTRNNLAWTPTKEQVNAFYTHWVNYLSYYRAWKSRLAILETYRKNDPDTEAVFIAPNMFNEELKYKPRLKLRDGDLAKNSSPDSRMKGAEFVSPIEDYDKKDTVDLDGEKIEISDLHSKEGIMGGFSCGFEDKDIYKSLWQKALSEGSTSAEVSGLSFSSQGGYGKQVARFDNDLISIKSLTAMGRVHRYAVERIGRIGIFWHKAKHVIEYERTVVPSPKEKNIQNALLGRPIVRKIREYIEILEPEKKYPDFESHSPKDTGAVNACVFKSTIIPISNSWGRLVYKDDDKQVLTGWEVPLWYEGADETLFPKPQIFFLLEPPKDANLEHSMAQLAEPQNLVFYTPYKEVTADEKEVTEVTDDAQSWNPVYGVDFTDKPVFDESILEPCNTNLTNKDRLDQLMPNAIDVLPGHGRFTFRVDPQQTPAGMANVYQPDSGLSGVLRTVSLQRNGNVTNKNGRKNVDKEIENLLVELSNSDENIKAAYDNIKNKLNSIPEPKLKQYGGLLQDEMVKDKPFVKIIWFKIVGYCDDFVVNIENDISDFLKLNKNFSLEKAAELTAQKIRRFEIEFMESKSVLTSLFSIPDLDNKTLKNIDEDVFKTIFNNRKLIKENKNELVNKVSEATQEVLNIIKKYEKNNFIQTTDITVAVKNVQNLIENFGVDKSQTDEVLAVKLQKELRDSEVFNGIKNFEILLIRYYQKWLKPIGDINTEINNFLYSATNNSSEFESKLSILKNNLKDVYFPRLLSDNILPALVLMEESIQKIEPFKTIDELQQKIDDYIKNGKFIKERIKSEVGNYYSTISSKLHLIDSAVSSGNDAKNEFDKVLTNYRSVWDEVTAPGMGLNRKTIALIVNKVENPKDLATQLSITPCIAKYKQFEEDLNALGVRLPVTHIFNGLQAPTKEWLEKAGSSATEIYKNLKFSEILPNIGAMDFTGMFPDRPMPEDFPKHVKFSQGFDKENLFAWAKAQVDYQIKEEVTLFTISLAEVKLSNARFKAEIFGKLNADGDLSKKEYGELQGDFIIFIKQERLMTFRQTRVILQNGKFKFELDPSKMEMEGVMKMITDATKNLQTFKPDTEEEGSGSFKVRLLKAEINKVDIPIGVLATLDLPPVTVGGGTTSMSNLSFGGHFLLQFFNPKAKTLEFLTGLGFYMGKSEAPFNFTAYIFGGGGFINTMITYSAKGGTAIIFILSIHGSAGLLFNVGWATGSVFIYLGIEGHYTYQNKVGSNSTFVLFVQMVGIMNFLGLASAYLIVRLELSYDSNKLIGKGNISIKIKICWCLKIRINRSFQKQFSGSKHNNNNQQASIAGSLG